MYYKLNDKYQLRGWQRLPNGIVDKKTGSVGFAAASDYRLLKLCSGVLDSNSVLFSQKDRVHLTAMEQAGILQSFEQPCSISEDQRYKEYDNRFIRMAHWSLTGGCNAKCRHCYMSAPHAAWGELSHQKCIDIIDQMADCGIHQVVLTGGEPLIRRDFFELVDRMTEKGIVISCIMSNGLLVNERLLDQLEARGLKPEFNMSFDGVGCHDWLRNVKGAEKKVLDAFRLCKERGFATGAEYCLHKGNMHAFRESVKLLDSLGCRSLKVNRLNLEGEATEIADYALTAEQENSFYLDYITHYYEDEISLVLMLNGVFYGHGKRKPQISMCKIHENEPHDNYAICGHARNVMHITADGRIVPCIPLGMDSTREMFPDIDKVSLKQSLNDSDYMSFINTRLKDYFLLQPECANCEYRNRCAGGCRGRAAMGGNIWGKDADACYFFRGGWYDKTKVLLEKLELEYNLTDK